MRFILRLIVFIFIAGFNIAGFAFEISELSNYQSIIIKQMTMTDSLYVTNKSKNAQFHSTKDFVNFFGKEKKHFDTQYEYVGTDQFGVSGKLKWYYYEKSASGRPGTSKLNYDKNSVMRAAHAGDMVVFAKNTDSKILLVVIQKGNKAINDVYNIIGITDMIDPEIQPKPSLWNRLFGGTDSRTEKLAKVEMAVELDSPQTLAPKKSRSKKPTEPDMDLNPDSYEKINFEAERHKTNKRVVLIGTPRIVDGDTIILEELFNIRVIGIDAPESKQTCLDSKGREYACGKQSTEYLQNLVGKGRVKCEIRGIGRFGRHTGLCYNMKDVNLNKAMVRNGQAVVSTYPPILFAKEENEAIKEKLGVWQGTLRHPHCFRHQKKQDWSISNLCDNNKHYLGWENLEL